MFKKKVNKKRHNFIQKGILGILLFTCFAAFGVKGQEKQKQSENSVPCKIGKNSFRCPNNFTQEKIIDKYTSLFKHTYKDSTTYFYVSFPKGKFDDNKVKKAIGDRFSEKKTNSFRWKELEKPFVMNLETKYEKKITNSLGFDNSKLLNFVSRYFEFDNQLIVLGYGYDTKAEPERASNVFSSLRAIGDNAIGCNAIATVINSITKEKPGDLQYCFLSGIKPAKSSK